MHDDERRYSLDELTEWARSTSASTSTSTKTQTRGGGGQGDSNWSDLLALAAQATPQPSANGGSMVEQAVKLAVERRGQVNGRNDAGFALARWCRDLGMTLEDAWTLAERYHAEVLKVVPDEPDNRFDLVELRRTFESAYSKPVEQPQSTTSPLAFRTLGEARRTYRRPEWLIRGALLREAFMMIGGAEKTLKSWTLLHFALATATGQPLFMDPRFPTTAQGEVTIITGEGGVSLLQDRIDHLCKMYGGVHPDSLNDVIHVTDEIAPVDSEAFRTGVARHLEDNPNIVMVILDPLFFYMGEDKEAGNVFSMGPAFARLRELVWPRALLIGHHFTKAGKDTLSTSSFTWAGSRESVDHWMLIRHASDPDLDQQTFTLEVVLSARRGFGWTARIQAHLGPLNEDTLQHDGSPSWLLQARDPDSGGAGDAAKRLMEYVADHPFEFQKSELRANVKLGKGFDRAWSEVEDYLRCEEIQRREGNRTKKRKLWGPVLRDVPEDAVDADEQTDESG